METVGIRELRQNASQVVAKVAAGEVITITDRGRPVAQMTATRPRKIEQLRALGRIAPATRTRTKLPVPTQGEPLSDVLAQMRDEERY